MGKIKRIYVEKKPPYAVHAKELLEELRSYLHLTELKNVRVLNRYDIENLGEETYRKSLGIVFSEPPVDFLYEEIFPLSKEEKAFSSEYLPGQFDQRADSAVQCVRLLNENEEPLIRSAVTYVVEGNLSDEELSKIKDYLINPVDSREAAEEKPDTLVQDFPEPSEVKVFTGFIEMAEDRLRILYDELGLAMTFRDFLFIKDYFKEKEKRDPGVTEIPEV